MPVMTAGAKDRPGGSLSNPAREDRVAGGGVHQQGQTWMGFAWDLRENLRTRLGQAGIIIAERIVVTTLAADAKNQPNAVREVFIADDDDNNLNNGTRNYNDLEAAALKRKLPYPIRKFCDFDATFARIVDRDIDYYADPGGRQARQINHHDGGRGVYFPDPDGHWLEIITRPYGSG